MTERDSRLAMWAAVTVVLTLAAAPSCGGRVKLPPIQWCATGEVFNGFDPDGLPKCPCADGHVRDADGKGCHPRPPVVPTTPTTVAPSPAPSPSPTTPPPAEPLPEPAPVPTPGTSVPSPAVCALPPMPECGRSEGPTGVYGCCWTDKARPLPQSQFDDVVDRVQHAVEASNPTWFDADGRVDEDRYVNEVIRQLRARGYCVARGGPSDEIGIKAANFESFQYDVHLGNGRPRHSGYTAYCSPGRF